MLLLSAIIAIIFCWECVGCKKDQGQYYELDVNIQIKKFGPGDRDNPGDCKNKGYVNIQSEKSDTTNEIKRV
ncbi:hypothetical protein H8356DRAFT_1418654 [Neocallimastix lanati (nom. inval.)]|nr:hypothetical protein H8356DRAFT_1418654 [Neocallimastix sp. JGI-2020a]